MIKCAIHNKKNNKYFKGNWDAEYLIDCYWTSLDSGEFWDENKDFSSLFNDIVERENRYFYHHLNGLKIQDLEIVSVECSFRVVDIVPREENEKT